MSFSGPPAAWQKTVCGVASPISGVLCAYSPTHYMATGDEPTRHSWEEQDSVEQQPAPKHNDGTSMHDMVIADILSRDPQWDVSVGKARHIRDQVADDLMARKAFGLSKYGTILQTHNGRNFLTDLYQELLDASVYARGRLLEVPEDSLEWAILFEVYDDIVGHLTKVRRLMNAA
jgi:hypothetical protein